MWTILLVEDEPFVRRSVRNAIPWEEAGFTIAGEASHGLEALAYIEEHNPDIVITDIFMPYMDGIELLQAAREKGSEAGFIMLTCANDFEHARLALEHGAASYIFKLSMDDDELMRALRKAREQLEKRKAGERLLRSQYQDCMPLLWRSLFGKELSAAEGERLESFRQAQSRYGQLYIAAALTGDEVISYDDLRRAHPSLLAEATAILSYSEAGQTTWFLWEEGDIPRPAGRIGLSCGKRELFGMAAPAGFTLEQAWLQVLRRLDDDFYGGSQAAAPDALKLAASDARNPTVPDAYKPVDLPTAQIGVPWAREQEVIRSFESMLLADCSARLAELWSFMEEARLPMALVKETALRLDLIMSRISRKQALEASPLLEAMSHRGLLESLDIRMRQYGKGMGGQRYPVTDHPEINKIILYLLQHYDQELSLQAMAQYVSLDENYLSVLFKKKTGDTFINYLQKIRVDEAKFYLAHTDLTVAELCERAGFANPSYFFKVFKRWTGATPNEYRTEQKRANGDH